MEVETGRVQEVEDGMLLEDGNGKGEQPLASASERTGVNWWGDQSERGGETSVLPHFTLTCCFCCWTANL